MQKITIQITFDVDEINRDNSTDVQRRYLSKHLLDSFRSRALDLVDTHPYIHDAEIKIN